MTRILLLEDNADMLMMMAQMLEWGDYEVIVARNGREGVQVLNTTDQLPDIIICDLLMPEMDGLTFLDTVRDHAEWSQIPVIMMSAHSSPQERQAAIEHGANDFLVKPFNLENFHEALTKWERH